MDIPGRQQTPVLPELRQELRVEAGAAGTDGAPTWLIIDAAQHRYVQIDQRAFHVLSRWRAGLSYAEVADIVTRDFGEPLRAEDVDQFVRFVADNNLTIEPVSGGWRHYASVADRGKHGWLMWMVHNYLYIKLPLLRPEPYLKAALPFVAPLYTRTFAIVVAAVGLIGLYLVSRQWDTFYTTFQHFFSWQGAAVYGVALILIKSCHELGHAFTATRFGCRVPSMGVCFLVMFPVLYTDVTDAWRLRDRRERLMIGGAGVAVELAIACFATFLWSFLPDGVFRSLAFSLATVGWVLSLAINLNPLMRFDGYYLFSDALGIDNLQSRANAFGQWRLREFLFGLRKDPPERLPHRTATVLTIYAWVVWVYRLILFTGIALLVYHMAFKVLGIALFAVEIIYFIARPIAGEIMRWWKDGDAIRATRRTRITVAVAVCMLLLTLLPWSTRVFVPAVVDAAEIARVYPQHGGMVAEIRVKSGDTVQAGDVLVRLTSAELEHEAALTTGRIELVRLRLSRRSSDADERSKSLVLEQELRTLTSTLEGLKKERADLIVQAPQPGVVAEFNSAVHVGRTIGRSEFVALIRGNGALMARGYVAQDDVSRLGTGNTGRFVPDVAGLPSIPVHLREVAQAGAATIEMPELASQYGGQIAVRPRSGDHGSKRLVPVNASYLATMAVDGDAGYPPVSARGVVVLEGDAQSIAGRAWRRIASVLVRESGF
ncbi:MAG: biotin/lipoyl-binding protein [Hyphomicrobium sp.]|nr:biotin/lipoyl-binding protein [Hyphomicrobium sp.]